MSFPVDRPAQAVQSLPEGLLWGLTLRPPQTAWDGRRHLGSRLAGSRREAVAAQAGVVAVVQRQDFLGVVAVSALYARQAAADLSPVWQPPTGPGARRAAEAGPADYAWQLPPDPAAPAAQVAVWCLDGRVGVWLPPCSAELLQVLHQELAQLLSLAPQSFRFHALAAAPARHSLALIDAAADAAWLPQAVCRPVAGALPPVARPADALVLRTAPPVAGGTAVAPAAGQAPAATVLPTLHSDAPWAVRPSLARLLSQPSASALAHASAVADGPILGAGLGTTLLGAGVEELNAAQVFAQESLWFEQAAAHGADPLDWRLRQLPAGTGAALARRVADSAGWRDGPLPPSADGGLRGRGFAVARLERPAEDGQPEIVWSAWVAEVSVHPRTGEVEVLRVVAGQDSESLRPADPATVTSAPPELPAPDPLLLADTRHLFRRSEAFDDWQDPAAEGGTPRSDLGTPAADALAHGRLAADGVLTLPAAAAIANAIHDATGVRLRQVPFDTEQLRLSLAGRRPQRAPGLLNRGATWLALGAAGVAGLAATAWPVKPALPLTSGPDVSVYSPQAIQRGRLVAAAGDCVVCHTAPGGRPNAGGLPLETPFGTIYSTNITPDLQTGIGRWSLAAFERAMRHGIHQDGRHLYPAFPYTAFARMSDGDIQSLYAYLMSEAPVAAVAPQTRLAFPYNIRASLAGWNLLFHDATPYKADPARTAEWNRGAYLVEGAGHCSACHSPRNALGAEKPGLQNYLAGGEAEGWTAPPLNRLAGGKTPWNRDELQQYLRTGFSPRHGVAAGPMAPVIHGLAQLPESDIGAMATYLLDLPGSTPVKAEAAPLAVSGAVSVSVPVPAVDAPTALRHLGGERIYQNACAVCHEAGSGPTLFGVRPNLAANTNLQADSPDNLTQTILHGIQNPANGDLGYMPGFKDSLDDEQISALAGYLRQRFAPEQKPWPDQIDNIRSMRAQAHP